ncbi:DEAD/DEAH box helicase [Chitinophaga sp. 30R24]|uniref:DEAD/DEAH box helicase n=1 Tax=Chitinophaga sp. 30R24 TaxID=3248838 RepID=UPI003B8F599E
MSHSNNPNDILSSWIALEVLSPQTFNYPHDLTSGKEAAIANFTGGKLPWAGGGEEPRPNYRLYYQVIIETIDYKKAVYDLLDIYADKRPERPSVKNEAVLATVVVDEKGRPCKAPSVAISSFGWGLNIALNQELKELAKWATVEKELVYQLETLIRKTDEAGNILPLDLVMLAEARSFLCNRFNIPVVHLKHHSFAIRSYEYGKNAEAPDPMLLNSFFISDLTTALQLFNTGAAPENLQRYLGARKPAKRSELLHNFPVLEEVIAPARIPPARWPGPGRHPLVLLQQAAVNIAFSELKGGGIMAVNGPPGTGKTTLLRDIVAGLVAERAEAMCTFNDPVDAFIDSGEKIHMGAAFLRLYQVDERLRGFEMVITSSNNKAVENVSAELPGLKSVADDATELRYFSSLSNALLDKDSWGLVAAVLGNAKNKNDFRQTFWWDKEVGFSTYLAEAAGTPQFVEAYDALTETRKRRKPHIITAEKAPSGPAAARLNWVTERAAFLAILADSRKQLAQLEKARQQLFKVAPLEKEVAQHKKKLDKAIFETTACYQEYQQEIAHLNSLEQQILYAQKEVAIHLGKRPGFFARLLGTQIAKVWKQALVIKHTELDFLIGKHRRIEQGVQVLDQQLQRCNELQRQLDQEYRQGAGKLDSVKKELATVATALGHHFIDEEFFRLPHEKKHLVSPWCDAVTQRLRDSVFIAAMRVHKAFIDAAAKPLKHNLGALMHVFAGGSLMEDKKINVLPDLWSSLFMVVPGISTTFASVERMFKELPIASLGWLLIDEAGQALPQAAVGAMMRTQKAIVVGDPMQIEPVVLLPELLTEAICKQFNVDPNVYNAPVASAQTLADAATTYYAEFDGKQGSRYVGVPLLVHRRCNDPMFSIANTIAYEGLMVHARQPGSSSIRKCLGTTAWIDIQGGALEKWSPEEGEAVLSLLLEMKKAGIPPDLYIVTPFTVVADELRKLIRRVGILSSWIEESKVLEWLNERVGTVHTAQGREAEAVIFVLGAPVGDQQGARIWAGKKPNLLNVAATRAKEVLYVIGNKQLWQQAGVFRELADGLPVRSPDF